MVEVAINSSTINNRRPHGSRSSGDIHSRSSGDIRNISSTILGPAGLEHLLNSCIGVERHTNGDNNIVEISRVRANAAARRSTSSQSVGKLGPRPHQRRCSTRIWHYLQKLVSRSTALALLPRGDRTNTATDARPFQVPDLHRRQSAIHLHRRCRHRPDTDHHHRCLLRTLTGALHPGIPRPSRHIWCSQASLWRVLFRVI